MDWPFGGVYWGNRIGISAVLFSSSANGDMPTFGRQGAGILFGPAGGAEADVADLVMVVSSLGSA